MKTVPAISRSRLLCSTILVLFPAYLVSPAHSAGPHQEIIPQEMWTNVVAGEELTLSFHLQNGVVAGERIGWSVLLENAVLRRGESVAASHQQKGGLVQQGAAVTIKFQVPDGSARTQLPISVFISRNGRNELVKTLWVYPKDAFENPVGLPEQDRFVVFDPKGGTATRFTQLKLKFQSERSVDRLSELQDGFIVIGEGVSFREYRGLAACLRKAAMNGCHVLCLAPSAGTIELNEKPDPVNANSADGEINLRPSALQGLSFRQNDTLTQFDKHLDYFSWHGELAVTAAQMRIVGKGGQTSVEFSSEEPGWTWTEARYFGGGRLTVTSLRMIEHWDAGPAPKHALRYCLAFAAGRSDNPGHTDNPGGNQDSNVSSPNGPNPAR